jgi:hypothetical protein
MFSPARRKGVENARDTENLVKSPIQWAFTKVAQPTEARVAATLQVTNEHMRCSSDQCYGQSRVLQQDMRVL